jgi:hypothetical protein
MLEAFLRQLEAPDGTVVPLIITMPIGIAKNQ